MGRKQTKRQQRRAKKEEGKKKKKNTAKEDDEEVQNRNGWNDDDNDGGKETFKEDKDVQNRIEHAEDLKEKNMTGFRVTVPENINPGEEFQVYVGSRIVRVRCPLNFLRGKALQITVPDKGEDPASAGGRGITNRRAKWKHPKPEENNKRIINNAPFTWNPSTKRWMKDDTLPATENDEEVQNEVITFDRIDDRNEYRTSVEYRAVLELYSSHRRGDMKEAVGLYHYLAVVYGCVRSMADLGSFFSECVEFKKLHVATPWLLEGAIRGSGVCRFLLTTNVYEETETNTAYALNTYWLEMHAKFNTYDEHQFDNSMVKHYKNAVLKSCVMCSKTDSKTLTLQQCKGCSLYCYCSETCQTDHWHEFNHKGECKQLHILNKYHKPYAKEIRDAAIGGNNHPALDKLRHKLGLSRPLQEYEELMKHDTHDGKPIDPEDYLVGREDGTVWVGSTPHPIGSYSGKMVHPSSKNDNTDYCEEGDG
ncbi:hypothetical protein FRACYDRAFT_248118 [Fragilariopsis cylindrus CCMP1102]|uniref:MYND-type domain-containing protein n=1 Tax=Fragilariopsis cylindrus CCMP1102 TaxID=635003 RepID=A0A1E7EVI6_9STRA|nr:hypothetical protein FRACYDRAFT_248118 [Fragilariopsis cylindrus CCMP1102]|eukprot:OEU09869.1 hypothetical protein FRACYDRAFT_248118 [Fragilariopsis cylindrus CCMP1102]